MFPDEISDLEAELDKVYAKLDIERLKVKNLAKALEVQRKRNKELVAFLGSIMTAVSDLELDE